MRTEDATPRPDQTIRLADYQRPDWLISETRLIFDLHPTATHVRAALTFLRNPARADEGPADLRLDGHSMNLLAAAIDGADVMDKVETDAEGATIAAAHLPQGGFVWTCETEIDPSANTSLEGLYLSNGMYCTQCEAEGFRKITYYPDRPDVMTRFHVRIEADKATPILLSNGNPTGQGDGWAEDRRRCDRDDRSDDARQAECGSGLWRLSVDPCAGCSNDVENPAHDPRAEWRAGPGESAVRHPRVPRGLRRLAHGFARRGTRHSHRQPRPRCRIGTRGGWVHPAGRLSDVDPRHGGFTGRARAQ